MGGFVEEEESVDNAAKRVLTELTGLKDIFMRQVATFGAVDRDPGGRVISVAYYALININDYNHKLVEEHKASWVKIKEIPELCFDHSAMVKKAMEVMQRHAATQPISFNLLPKLFTLSQLQSLYEAIFDGPLDKRNFRKRIAEMNFIERTTLIDKTNSRRGASLYTFNKKAFQKEGKFKI